MRPLFFFLHDRATSTLSGAADMVRGVPEIALRKHRMAPLTTSEIQKAYARALTLQNAGNLEGALQIYGSIIETNPKVAEVHFQVGRIYTLTDRFARAMQHLKAATSLRVSESAVWYAWSEAIALGGSAADEKEFLRLLKGAPVAVETRIALQERFGARRASSKPATGGAKTQEIRLLLGLIEARRFADAERQAARIVKKNPGSALALNIMATAQANQKKFAQAELNYRKAIQIDPKYAEAHDHLGRLYLDNKREEKAAEHFRRAVALAPGLPTALVSLGSLMTRAGKAQDALLLLNRAVATGPDVPACHIALGNAYNRLRDYQPAEKAFQRAVDLTGGKAANAIALLAQAQARSGKDAIAMENFDIALSLDPDNPAGVGGKASLLQTLGRFDEAEVLFRRGFELAPNNGENYRSFIASHKTRPGDPVIAMMLERYNDPELPKTDRMNIGFAIAKALEDVKEYDRVFRYLDEANALMREISPYNIVQRFQQVRLTKEAFDNFDWHGARIEGTTDFAPIFVTGMPRSGTTLIEQIIASHSLVTGAGEVGEAAGAAHTLAMPNGQPLAVGLIPPEDIAAMGHDFATYIRARFPDTPQITDKSIQSYMSLGLLKLAMPKSRFIIVRRDPRDNLLSIYKNKFPDDTHLYAYDQRDLAQYYGTFVEMIDFWRARVPDWFHEVQYEEQPRSGIPQAYRGLRSGVGRCLSQLPRKQAQDRDIECLPGTSTDFQRFRQGLETLRKRAQPDAGGIEGSRPCR